VLFGQSVKNLSLPHSSCDVAATFWLRVTPLKLNVSHYLTLFFWMGSTWATQGGNAAGAWPAAAATGNYCAVIACRVQCL